MGRDHHKQNDPEIGIGGSGDNNGSTRRGNLPHAMINESLGEYLSTMHRIREDWDVPAHKELWFRAEGAFVTLQPA
jgi:hypothetical protein